MAKSKRKYKKKALPARFGELATLERRRQLGGVTTEVIDRDLRGGVLLKRHTAVCECQLDVYKFREQLTDKEYDAGLIYRRAFMRYVLGIQVDDKVQGGRSDAEMAMLSIPHSKKLLDQAHAVLSQPQSTVVRAICGLDDSAGNTYRFETFRRGLEKLVDIWKV
jgi:hypothetical protein